MATLYELFDADSSARREKPLIAAQRCASPSSTGKMKRKRSAALISSNILFPNLP